MYTGRSTLKSFVEEKVREESEFYQKEDEDYRGIVSAQQPEDFMKRFGQHIGGSLSGHGIQRDS